MSMKAYLTVAYRPGRSGWTHSAATVLDVEVAENFTQFFEPPNGLGKWFDIRLIPEGQKWLQDQQNKYQPRYNPGYDWYESNWELHAKKTAAEEAANYYAGCQ
jgi:hypothetical protein